MIRKRFRDIGKSTHFRCAEESLQHKDKLFWVRVLINRFNNNMIEMFRSGWIVFINESMVVFLQQACPGMDCFESKTP